MTRTVSVNGWAYALTALQAAVPGYQGGRAKSATFVGNNAAITYLHINESATQPVTFTDGLPLSTVAASAPGPSYTAENVDMAGIWLYTPSAQNVTICVINVT